jgi:hypothetical protein
MIKLRVLLLTAIAVLAASAMATASASALEPCTHEAGSGHYVLCVENPAGSGLLLVTTLETFTSKKTAATTSKLAVPALKITIVCTTAADEGTLTAPPTSVSKLVIKFEGCTVEGEEGKCEVTNVTTKEISGAFSLSSEVEDVTFKPESGSTFAEVKIKSKAGMTCTAAASSPLVVKGEQLCTPKEIEAVDRVNQTLSCSPSGSKLTVAGHPTEFELTEEVALSGTNKGFAWDIIEGT